MLLTTNPDKTLSRTARPGKGVVIVIDGFPGSVARGPCNCLRPASPPSSRVLF